MTELLEKLQTIKVGSLPGSPHGSIKTVRSDMSIASVLQYLQENKILSAPVVAADAAEDAPWKEKFVGIVDVVSLVVYAMEALSTPSVIPEEDEEAVDSEESAFDISALPSEFASQPISSISDNPDMWNEFLPIQTDATLFDALVILSNFRMKRVPVLDEKTFEVVNFITQTTLIRQLQSEAEEYGEVVKQTLDDLGLGDPKEVYSVRGDKPVKDAFELIQKHKISGVPVVGADGLLLGSISARDIYYIATSPSKISMLHRSAARFLGMISRQHSWDDSRKGVLCKSSESLAVVMQRIVKERAHRVYLTDEQDRPYRVISLVDILEKFVASPEAQCSIM